MLLVLGVGATGPAAACISPERPFLPQSQEDMRTYADLIRGDFEAYIADVHIIYKLHVFFGISIVLVFPFTRLVHIISAPIWYFGRGYQIVRQKKAA